MRIMHRIIATNITLKEVGVVDDTRCTVCNNQRDSIEHVFWECDCIKGFWNKLDTLLRHKCETVFNVHFTENGVLYGVDNCMNTDSVVDFIVLQAKQFIYKCRFDKRLPTLSFFVHQLTFRYKIEKYNANF